MARFSIAFAIISGLSVAGSAAAATLAPQSGFSVHLGGMDGTVYYTAEADGYRIVATMARNHGSPIRFISTLTAGQRMILSIPQAVDRRSVEFEIRRDGDAIIVNEPVSATTATANLAAERAAADVQDH